MSDEIEQLHKKIAYLTEQVDRWEDDALRLMEERNKALEERDEAKRKCDEHLIKTLQAYDRLSILMENIMEQWLDGDNAPPKELIDAYYDVKDDVNEHLNVDRLHEQVIPANSEFYNTIQQKFKFDVDDTPNLW
jgi:molecular chaperone GrpE (heat shock protein)